MGPIRDRHGPSGHGFDLGTHIWVLHDIFMGQVGMGLIWEHIYGSCMAYLCAKFGLNWEHKCRDLDLQVLVGWWWGACPGGKVGSLASLWVEATASRWLGLRVVAACGDCGTLWGLWWCGVLSGWRGPLVLVWPVLAGSRRFNEWMSWVKWVGEVWHGWA